MLARRFLWVVAGLTMLVMAAALVYRLFGAELMRFTMVPTAAFEGGPPPAPERLCRQEAVDRPAGHARQPGACGCRPG